MAAAVTKEELRHSKRQEYIGELLASETRFYHVNLAPESVLDRVSFGRIGDTLPGRNAEQDVRSVRLQRIEIDHYQGQLQHALVTVHYATRPPVKTTVWTTNISTRAETIEFDLSLPRKRIPNGAQRLIGVYTETALLENVIAGIAFTVGLRLYVGKINSVPFDDRGWPEKTALFSGATVTPVTGTGGIFEPGRSRVEMNFQVIVPSEGIDFREFADWNMRVPIIDEGTGLPAGTQVEEFKIYPEADFRDLWGGTGYRI